MYEITFSPRAKRELNEAINWYEEQQDGLGKRLTKEVENKLAVIMKQPDRYPVIQNDIRQVNVDVFPYQILYYIDEKIQRVTVQSVFHTKRNPQNKYRP